MTWLCVCWDMEKKYDGLALQKDCERQLEGMAGCGGVLADGCECRTKELVLGIGGCKEVLVRLEAMCDQA